jgi:hypothetical protein
VEGKTSIKTEITLHCTTCESNWVGRANPYLEVEGDEGEAPTEATRRPRSPRQARPYYGRLESAPLLGVARSIVAAPRRGGCAEAGADGGEEAEGAIGHASGGRGRRPATCDCFSDGRAARGPKPARPTPLSFSPSMFYWSVF